MGNVIAIVRRELLSFFVSPIAYFVITGFVLLGAYFFFNLLGVYNMVIYRYSSMPYAPPGQMPNLNQWVVEGLYQTLLIILVFLVPMLTMRTIAEERRRGTFELLATSPISVGQIIWGKFISVALILTLMLGLVTAFPLLLIAYGDPEVNPIWTGFLGLLLAGLGFVSVGMAVSSFTENQIVAAVSSMVALLLLYVIHSPAESIGGTTAVVLMYLSPIMQVRDMMRGVITLQSVIYFLSLISLGIFVSCRALDAQRWR